MQPRKPRALFGREDEWGFAGFTSATFTGNLGGRIAAHRSCEAELPGAHLCHAAEYVLSNSTAPVPAAGAWLDASTTQEGDPSLSGAPSFGRHIDASSACAQWTQGKAGSGPYVNATGALALDGGCAVARSLACCNGPARVDFAGFTSTSHTGDLGGRVAAHALCDAELPGAHMCHAAEYVRSLSTEAVPAPGAWLDASATARGTSTLGGSPLFGRMIDASGACTQWTQGSAGSGPHVSTTGALSWSGGCAIARRIACCY